MAPTLKQQIVQVNMKNMVQQKHCFYNNRLTPMHLWTSDLSNAALLRAGVSGLHKHVVISNELVQIQTQTKIQIWVSSGCLLNIYIYIYLCLH